MEIKIDSWWKTALYYLGFLAVFNLFFWLIMLGHWLMAKRENPFWNKTIVFFFGCLHAIMFAILILGIVF
jgi:hypothetical protein